MQGLVAFDCVIDHRRWVPLRSQQTKLVYAGAADTCQLRNPPTHVVAIRVEPQRLRRGIEDPEIR